MRADRQNAGSLREERVFWQLLKQVSIIFNDDVWTSAAP